MSLEKLLKQIRTIIREEIEYALDKKMNESVVKKTDRDTLHHGMSLMKELGVVKEQKKQPQKQVHPVRNGMNSIQDILNETRMSMEAAMSDDDYPEMRFTTDSLNAYAKNHIDATPSGVNPNDITPEVASALTRDYSALMAKINEKKGR